MLATKNCAEVVLLANIYKTFTIPNGKNAINFIFMWLCMEKFLAYIFVRQGSQCVKATNLVMNIDEILKLYEFLSHSALKLKATFKDMILT